MDFNEVSNQPSQVNKAKNRLTLLALAVVFVAPVLFAYLAYFGGWFMGGSKSHGQIIPEPWHIEDLRTTKTNFGTWTDSEYMSKWNWLLVIDDNKCDIECEINYLMLQQIHLGLAKNIEKNNYLMVLNEQPVELTEKWQSKNVMQIEMRDGKVLLKEQLRNLNNNPIEANAIYLVDPLGNIFMKYELIQSKEEAPIYSKGLRSDINRIMRMLDVSTNND
ncbi:MAG: hypothetical protein HWE27_09470 [Gammaproteobacteria bacterium]|nr:hypothetical protein [Gammaproteobacteria bacterium]